MCFDKRDCGCSKCARAGKCADYIPELAKADPGEFGLCVRGVGGGIVADVPGRWGIGTYGPALNAKGNSAGGISALQHMSHLLRLNVFS